MLGLVLAVAGWVTVTCRAESPWASAYGVFLRLGLVVIALRTAFHLVLGSGTGTTVLFTLPSIASPEWAQGIRFGGPVTAEGVASALYDGFRLAVLLACVGAANSLANPKRLLRSLPAALYEVSVVVVVGLTVAPQMVASTRQVRRARRLRGDTARGWRALRSVMVPVLADSLERSVTLAAAMDSRGYGRRSTTSNASRRITSGLVLLGLTGICVGVYGLLDVGSPSAMGVPALVVGVVVSAAGMASASARMARSRYRPDRWGLQEALVVSGGVAAVAGVVLAGSTGVEGLIPSVVPLEFPRLPWLPAIGVLTALLPAWAVPATTNRTGVSSHSGAGV